MDGVGRSLFDRLLGSWRRRLGSRLVQFAVLGGAIFLLAPRPDNRRRILVPRAVLAGLEQAEAARRGAALAPSTRRSSTRWMRAPSSPYARDVRMSAREIGRLYGQRFAEAVAALTPGAGYSDAIPSSFGWHRVRLVERVAGRVPAFNEVQSALGLDHALWRRQQVVGDWLRRTAAEYDIEVDGKRMLRFEPTQRIAMRSEASAED